MWRAEKRTSVVTHVFRCIIHFTDNEGTVTHTTLFSTSPLLPRCGLVVFIPCISGTTTSGHFADSHCLAGYEPNLTNSQSMVAWAESQDLHGAQAASGPISSILSWIKTHNFTEEANAHNFPNMLAAQLVFELPTCRLRNV